MVALKTEMRLKGINGTRQDLWKSPKTKFGVFGKEMIEKKVKKSGSSGRVYLPSNWVGKHVKIIRID